MAKTTILTKLQKIAECNGNESNENDKNINFDENDKLLLSTMVLKKCLGAGLA